MSPEQGVTYDVELSDGTVVHLRFEGFGKFMHPIWRDVDTGTVLNGLPPYKSCIPQQGVEQAQEEEEDKTGGESGDPPAA